MTLSFHPLTLDDREAMQAVTLHSGRRNCNYTFANLAGWRFRYNTEVCVTDNTAVLRYNFGGQRAYMTCTREAPSPELIEALLNDSHGDLMIYGLEDEQLIQDSGCKIQDSGFKVQWSMDIVPLRGQYDYIYRRNDLIGLHGKHLAGKRNHLRHFRAEHPDFEYRPLRPELFDDCRRLTELWEGEKNNGNPSTALRAGENKEQHETIGAEKQAMETFFTHWDALGMTGGSIFAEGRMVAFTCGAAVTDDTIDVCVEKADRRVEGAFAIINQQFAEHLPEQYVYVNREEDMDIPGLRLAKMSYHPEILLTFNAVHITENDRG